MISKIFKKIARFAVLHKAISGVIVFVLAGSGFLVFRAFSSGTGEVRYVLAAVEKGTFVASVSGSGQVSVSNQVDIKSKTSGDAVYIGVNSGNTVGGGALLVQLDTRDAQKAVRDAEANLEAAKLSLEKLKKPADALSILQAENAFLQAKESKQKGEDDLRKAYEDGFNTVANAFLDLPTVMAGLQDMLFGTTLSGSTGGQSNLSYYADAVKNYDSQAMQYKNDAEIASQRARAQYDKNFQDYKAASRFSETRIIESIIDETYETTKSIAEAVKSSGNLIQFYEDKLTERNLKPSALADTHLASLNVYTGKTNAHLLNLLSTRRALQTSKEAVVNAERSITEKTESLAKLKAGADSLDIQSQELAITQRENALLDAKEKLADYFIRAPFDGILAKLNVKKGDSIAGSAVVATLITKQRIAEISLNEVDIAKIKVGERATLTFDAVEGLSITGEVQEIDTLGTVTQGVVTYNVKIGFDTQDDRIKPGMSVSTAIITDSKPNVLLVPNSAIKLSGNAHYVEMLEGVAIPTRGNSGITSQTLPIPHPVELGLANDSVTEITNGLKEGDVIIVRTINSTASQTTPQQTSGLRLFGGGGGGGGFRPR